MTDTAGWDDMVLVGVVARPHGIRGEIAVNLETDFAEARFRPGAPLVVKRAQGSPEALEVTAVRFHKGRALLTVDGVTSMDAARTFAGAEIRMAREALGPLPEGVYHHADLVGCEAVTAAGETIGVVAAVDGGPGTSRLVIRSRRGEVLVPLARDICRVDVAARRITVTPPEGLLELNGDWRSE